MAMQRARTAKEYADWVDQARFEVADLRASMIRVLKIEIMTEL